MFAIRRRHLAWILAFGFLLSAFCFVFRAALLTAVAKAWVVDEPLQKADAIVVLGGRPDLRPFEAARLYRRGIAPRVLYMDVKLSPTAEMGLTLSEREMTRRILLSNNVPEAALVAIGHGVTSTFDESQAVREWVIQTGAKSILITTDLFHTRRVRHQFLKELKGTGVQVRLHAITPPRYDVNSWWRDEEGFLAFQNEILKSVYYCFAH